MNSFYRWLEVDPGKNSDRPSDGSRPAHSMARRRRGHTSISESIRTLCSVGGPIRARLWKRRVGLSGAQASRLRRDERWRIVSRRMVRHNRRRAPRSATNPRTALKTGLFGVGLDSEFGAVGDLILRSRDVPSPLMTSCGEALLICRIELRNANTKSFPF
jgi:hypothetical protein